MHVAGSVRLTANSSGMKAADLIKHQAYLPVVWRCRCCEAHSQPRARLLPASAPSAWWSRSYRLLVNSLLGTSVRMLPCSLGGYCLPACLVFCIYAAALPVYDW